jgi:hypothetical protein
MSMMAILETITFIINCILHKEGGDSLYKIDQTLNAIGYFELE